MERRCVCIHIARPIRRRTVLTLAGRADVIRVAARRTGMGRRTARLVRGGGLSPTVRRTVRGDGGSGGLPGCDGIRPIRRPALAAGRISRILRVIRIAHGSGGCGIIPRKTRLVGWG